MVVANMLVRGMLVGLLAALLSFAFLKVAGEPSVDRAIAFETQQEQAKGHASEPELVSRGTQAGLGLLTGVVVYNVAFGGLFALVYALAYGRMGPYGPRAASLLIALSGLVAVYLIPSLKYPANPPSVGEAETIAMRTQLYFAMIAISLAAMVAAWTLRNRLTRRFGPWDAALIAAGAYLAVMVVAYLALPGVNEVPETFPATVLWQFRLASMGAQAVMWATLGLGFGALAERAEAGASPVRLRAV